MKALRQKMIDEMLLRGFSPRTHDSYLNAVLKLSLYYKRSPDQLNIDDLQAYFLYLAKAGMPITQLQHQLGHTDIHSTMRYLHWVPQFRQGQGVDLLAGLEVGHG